MKRCPKCSRTFTTNTQKFCTHDGVVLETLEAGPVATGSETVRIDAADLDDDAPTKAISRELASEFTGDFDPLKTVMSRPEGTFTSGPRNTSDIGSTPRAPGQVSPPPQEAAPPPLSSPSAPTMALGSGPIAASAPLPPPPAPPPAAPVAPSPAAPLPPQPSAPAQAKKKSRLPLVLGILVVLLVLFAGLGVAAYLVGPRIISALQSRRSTPEPSPVPTREPTPKTEATPNAVAQKEPTVAPEPPAYSPPADAVEFVNSKAKLDGKLAEHYLDFSFYYPERWQKDPSAGVPGAANFAKVERRLPPDFTQENFAVGWYSSGGSAEADRSVFPSLAAKLSAQFEKSFPGYSKVSENETKVGVYDGYEFRFEGMSRNTSKGDLKLWGRLIFLPPVDGGKNGVTLLMLATSLAPELKSVDDVGVKGELPMMLESFRFGKK